MTMLRIAWQVWHSPKAASLLAAALIGRPEIGQEMLQICRRESRCRPIGVHARDAWAARRMWVAAVRVGYLDPERCHHHRWGDGQWSVSGSWGASRAYTLRFLPGCWPKKVLDITPIGAYAVARRLSAAGKTKRERRRTWAGGRQYDRR